MKKLYNRSKCSAYILACETADGGFADRLGGHTNMEATRFAVDTLNILLGTNCKEYIQTSACIKWVQACQNPDGGFRHVPEEDKSKLDATYYAIRILKILNGTIPNKNRCLRWLKAQQYTLNSISPVTWCLDDIYYSIRASEMLDAQIHKREKIVEYIETCPAPSGGFRNMEGEEEDMDRTYEAIHTLNILRKKVPQYDLHIKWIIMCSGPYGGFRNKPSQNIEMRATYWALHSLELLGVHPPQCKKHAKWICTHQATDGGFVNDDTSISNVWYTYCAVGSLDLLGCL